MAKRISSYAHKSKMGAALKKYKAKSFLVQPIYMSINGTDSLLDAEARLIVDYDSVDNGFNIQAYDTEVGPYGVNHSKALRAAFATPESKAKRQKLNADPEFRARRGRAIAKALADPKEKARRAEASRKSAANPEHQARRSASLKAAHARPETKAKHRAGLCAALMRPGFIEKKTQSLRATYAKPENRAKILEAGRQGRLVLLKRRQTTNDHLPAPAGAEHPSDTSCQENSTRSGSPIPDRAGES